MAPLFPDLFDLHRVAAITNWEFLAELAASEQRIADLEMRLPVGMVERLRAEARTSPSSYEALLEWHQPGGGAELLAGLFA